LKKYLLFRRSSRILIPLANLVMNFWVNLKRNSERTPFGIQVHQNIKAGLFEVNKLMDSKGGKSKERRWEII
jgi:hypothetical protein